MLHKGHHYYFVSDDKALLLQTQNDIIYYLLKIQLPIIGYQADTQNHTFVGLFSNEQFQTNICVACERNYHLRISPNHTVTNIIKEIENLHNVKWKRNSKKQFKKAIAETMKFFNKYKNALILKSSKNLNAFISHYIKKHNGAKSKPLKINEIINYPLILSYSIINDEIEKSDDDFHECILINNNNDDSNINLKISFKSTNETIKYHNCPVYFNASSITQKEEEETQKHIPLRHHENNNNLQTTVAHQHFFVNNLFKSHFDTITNTNNTKLLKIVNRKYILKHDIIKVDKKFTGIIIEMLEIEDYVYMIILYYNYIKKCLELETIHQEFSSQRVESLVINPYSIINNLEEYSQSVFYKGMRSFEIESNRNYIEKTISKEYINISIDFKSLNKFQKLIFNNIHKLNAHHHCLLLYQQNITVSSLKSYNFILQMCLNQKNGLFIRLIGEWATRCVINLQYRYIDELKIQQHQREILTQVVLNHDKIFYPLKEGLIIIFNDDGQSNILYNNISPLPENILYFCNRIDIMIKIPYLMNRKIVSVDFFDDNYNEPKYYHNVQQKIYYHLQKHSKYVKYDKKNIDQQQQMHKIAWKIPTFKLYLFNYIRTEFCAKYEKRIKKYKKGLCTKKYKKSQYWNNIDKHCAHLQNQGKLIGKILSKFCQQREIFLIIALFKSSLKQFKIEKFIQTSLNKLNVINCEYTLQYVEQINCMYLEINYSSIEKYQQQQQKYILRNWIMQIDKLCPHVKKLLLNDDTELIIDKLSKKSNIIIKQIEMIALLQDLIQLRNTSEFYNFYDEDRKTEITFNIIFLANKIMKKITRGGAKCCHNMNCQKKNCKWYCGKCFKFYTKVWYCCRSCYKKTWRKKGCLCQKWR